MGGVHLSLFYDANFISFENEMLHQVPLKYKKMARLGKLQSAFRLRYNPECINKEESCVQLAESFLSRSVVLKLLCRCDPPAWDALSLPH